jgi:hypothetical protein
MPALKCLPVEEITSTLGIEAQHGIAHGGEEGRRHRVHALGPVEHEVGDATRGDFQGEELGIHADKHSPRTGRPA